MHPRVLLTFLTKVQRPSDFIQDGTYWASSFTEPQPFGLFLVWICHGQWTPPETFEELKAEITQFIRILDVPTSYEKLRGQNQCLNEKKMT